MNQITYFVTLNWNTTGLLKRMVESVEGTTSEAHRWIILDNGSENGDVAGLIEFARQTFGDVLIMGAGEELDSLSWGLMPDTSRVIIVSSHVNLGCIEGHNLTLDVARAWSEGQPHRIVLINTDVEITEERWLSKVCGWADERPAVGIVGMEHNVNAVCAPAIFLDKNGNWYLHETQMKKAEPVEGESVGFGLVLVRWPVLDAGLRFDTHYEMYYKQDDDFCFHVRFDLGLEVWAYPVGCVHYGAGALRANEYRVGKANGWDEFDQMKQANQRYFAKKWRWALGDRRRNMEEQAAWLVEMKEKIGSMK